MKLIPSAVAHKAAMAQFKLNKNSPQVLFFTGIAGVTCSTVMACRATLRLQTTLDKAGNDLDQLRLAHESQPEALPAEQLKKDITIVYVRSVVEIAKLYAPAAVVGLMGVACLTKSHSILNERHTAMVAAYTAVDEAFGKYRQRVVDKYGEDEDREFRHGAVDTVIYDDTGTEPLTVLRANPDEAPSMYARWFDQVSSGEWSKEFEYNLIFLRNQQNRANDLLKSRGFLVLNDVYRMLGMDPTNYGALVGWVYGPDGKDNFVDFGCFSGETQESIDFMNGRLGAILLDFNVDGTIYDKIEGHGHRGGAISWQS